MNFHNRRKCAERSRRSSRPTQRRLIRWLRENERRIVVDPIILGEIRFGIHLLAPGARRRADWSNGSQTGIERIICLPWQSATGLRWARLLADLRRAGRAMPLKDSLIAATALVHGLTIATRNKRDFLYARVETFDPFEAARTTP